MKYFELLTSLESEEWVSVEDRDGEKAKLVEAAHASNSKTRNINIRLSERDLYKLKAKALQEGMPYQTLVTSILHKNI
jgi:predicted DNA binding CopG/RHH family protein